MLKFIILDVGDNLSGKENQMLVHNQTFYERHTGQPHKIMVTFDHRNGSKCYDVRVDNEFYATAEHRSGAFDEVVDIIKANNWSPLRPI